MLSEISSKAEPSTMSGGVKKRVIPANRVSTSFDQQNSVQQSMLPTLNVVSAWGAVNGGGVPSTRAEHVMTPQACETLAILETNQLKIIRR